MESGSLALVGLVSCGAVAANAGNVAVRLFSRGAVRSFLFEVLPFVLPFAGSTLLLATADEVESSGMSSCMGLNHPSASSEA